MGDDREVEGRGTDHADCLHLTVGEGEKTLARERHLGISVLVLSSLWLELAPEGLGKKRAAG